VCTTMPLTLHPHLKRQLAFDDIHIDPVDVIEDTLPEHNDPEEQAAKRRRIENIASQYLQGKPPVILSAGLRGPFDDGWKNPWVQTKKGRRKPLDKGKAAESHESAVGGRDGRKARPIDAKRRTRSAARKTVPEQTLPSPETARAVDGGIEHYQESHTLDEIDIPAATAPLPEEHDSSSATEFFSLETAQCVSGRSPLADPFWLRRPESDGQFDMRNSINRTTDHSPSRLRGTVAQPDQRRTLQLAVPKVPVGLCAPPENAALPVDIQSSASATMVISSPVKPATHTEDEHTHHPDLQGRRLETLTTLAETSTLASEVHPAQVQSVLPIAAPIIAHEMPPANSAPPVFNPVSGDTQESITLQQGSHERPTREIILCSAERLVDHSSASSSTNSQTKQTEVAASAQGSTRRPQHNTSIVAPESSTGFVYKKIGSTKWTISSAPRSKPRAVNFNSSPLNKRDVSVSSKPSSQKNTTVDADAARASSGRIPQAGERTEQGPVNETTQEQQSLGSTHSGQQSDMSTQAAMLLAQLEFQESTYPVSSPGTPRPWSQQQEETPQPMLPEPSPSITPVSVFRPQLEQAQALTSVVRDPPISTQDLFAAASPFALSTVKKKADAPQRSLLRKSIMSFDGHNDGGSDASPKSPTSLSDRVPLKEKNMVPSPWSFSFEKGLQNSQSSPKGNARRLNSDVELPQLDLHTSLDDYGPYESLHFTDRLLRNIDDT
jgi:hypothetical protein